MVRIGDTVRTEGGPPGAAEGYDGAEVEAVGEDGCLRVRYDLEDGRQVWQTLSDGGWWLLCANESCGFEAQRFTDTGQPICDTCAERYRGKILDVRPDVPPPLVQCVCGDSLDDGKSEGVWTMGDIACEYRTCLHCHSTRAWMPRDRVPGRTIVLLEKEEQARTGDSFLDALEWEVCGPFELARNGVTLARGFQAANGQWGWRVMPPTREV